MKNNGYEEPEKEMSFSGEGRQGQALRIMEALSGVDEELLERANGEKVQKIISSGKHINRESEAEGESGRENAASWGTRGRKSGSGKRYQFRRQYVKPWAAVLCLAVVGALSWGGYQMTVKVNDSASGGSMNDNMAMNLEAIELEGYEEGAGCEEARSAETAAEDTAVQNPAGQAAKDPEEQITDEWKSQENAGISDTGGDAYDVSTTNGTSGSPGTTVGNSGTSQRQDTEADGVNGEAEKGTGTVQESASKESNTEEGTMIDSDGCPPANQKKLTEKEARNQEALGAYIPDKVPQGYAFENAFSNLDFQGANLTVTWSRGMDSIMWTVAEVDEIPQTVDINAPETYDERLYEVPHAETVPEEYRQSVNDPVFAWEDFSQEAVRSRMLSYDDRGDTGTPRGNFSVLYPNNIVIKFNGRGTAEEIWEMFAPIGD